MKQTSFQKILHFLDRLDTEKIVYRLERQRDEALMVVIAIPGERWEVEFLADGSVEVERFISDGNIFAEDALDELFSDQAHESMLNGHAVFEPRERVLMR